jgi:hypothetical protein
VRHTIERAIVVDMGTEAISETLTYDVFTQSPTARA